MGCVRGSAVNVFTRRLEDHRAESLNPDVAGIQFHVLNKSKGPAVHVRPGLLLNNATAATLTTARPVGSAGSDRSQAL